MNDRYTDKYNAQLFLDFTTGVKMFLKVLFWIIIGLATLAAWVAWMFLPEALTHDHSALSFAWFVFWLIVPFVAGGVAIEVYHDRKARARTEAVAAMNAEEEARRNRAGKSAPPRWP